jgi:hypothetical protein
VHGTIAIKCRKIIEYNTHQLYHLYSVSHFRNSFFKENLYSAFYYSPVKCSSAAENRAYIALTETRAEGAEITNTVNIVTRI